MTTVTPTPLSLSRPTAPLPADVVELAERLELRLAPPVDRLRHEIGELEESLYVQRQVRDSAAVQMRNRVSSRVERAAARASFRSAVAEIRVIVRELAGLKAELATATCYGAAVVCAVQLAGLAMSSGTLSDLDADSLAHAEDLMAGTHATLAAAGRLDLVGGA